MLGMSTGCAQRENQTGEKEGTEEPREAGKKTSHDTEKGGSRKSDFQQ
jgi:hypothetical protein